MDQKRIYSLIVLVLWCVTVCAQSEHHLYVNSQNKGKGVYATVNEALRQAETYADDNKWTTIHIAPGVYWIDNPDDPAIRKPEPGENIPYGMKVRLNRTRIIGTGDSSEDVVLACNRGQTQGADGNFTMLHITGDDIQVENLTLGNYCNVDLDYKRDSRLSRQRRADAIVQAQLVICNGDRYEARKCRFISRLNLCPFAGARHALFDDCYFECTDDALCGTGTYRHCRFTFFSSKPFYCTSLQGAVFEDCDIHSKVQGVQYLTKVSDPVTMRNCRWTSDDPNLTIEWTKKPNPKKRCLMENCTLNGKPLNVPMPPDVPMPVTTPMLPLMNQSALAQGHWTLDAYKPKDTAAYDWSVDTSRPAWCFGEGMDGAEGCYGMIQNVRGARMMYTGKTDETYHGQTLVVELSPCKSAGQGFGSATGQYLDICIKFDTQTLTGYGVRFVRTSAYDKAVEVVLVEYKEGTVTTICSPEKCVLFKKDCRVTLSAEGSLLSAQIERGDQQQKLTATIGHPNNFGGIHIQHTGSTGASATVVQSINCTYHADESDGLHLVWSDEFNGDGAPDSTIWNFEEGFARNQEAQWYQSANAWQHDGCLVIEARREHRNNPTYNPMSRHWGKKREFIDYSSACLTTAGKKSFLYGRLEVRAKIPTAAGAWPAIWTLGSNIEWPSCGEVDIMEYYRIGGIPHILANAAWGNDQRYSAVWNSKKIPFTHFTDKNQGWAEQFHIWRMDWNEEHIRIYLDDELLNDIPLRTTVNGSIGHGENPFRKPHYILLNLALGGQNGGPIDDSALPMRYEIDYVRVYQ